MMRWTWANTGKTLKKAQTIMEEWSEWEEGTKWCKWLPACVIIAVFQDLSGHPGGTLGMMSGLWSWYLTRRSWYLRAQPCRGGQYLPGSFEVILLWGMRWWNKWLCWSGRCTYLCNLTPIDIVLHPFGACNALDWYNTHNNAAEEAWYSMLIKCSCKVGCNQSNFNHHHPPPATNSSRI